MCKVCPVPLHSMSSDEANVRDRNDHLALIERSARTNECGGVGSPRRIFP
jgi:hypothetical protein